MPAGSTHRFAPYNNDAFTFTDHSDEQDTISRMPFSTTTGGLHVCHILGTLNPSGAEVMMRAAAPYWPRLGVVKSTILATGAQEGDFARDLRSVGYAIEHLPCSRNPTWHICLYQALRRLRPTIVHIHTERAAMHIAMVARLAGCRVIRTLHSAYPFRGLLRWQTVFRRAVSRAVGVQHVAIGPSVLLNEQRFGNRCRMIANWLDTARFSQNRLKPSVVRASLGCTDHDIALITVGSCSSLKNHVWLLQALADCRDLPIIYWHCGHGELHTFEEEYARKNEVADRCRFLGWRDDIAELLGAADGFVMPSEREGFSIATIEALHMGLPCLLADVPGLKDVRAIPGVRLFPNPLDRQTAGHHLRLFIDDLPKLRLAASVKGDVISRRHGPIAGASQYAALYRRLHRCI